MKYTLNSDILERLNEKHWSVVVDTAKGGLKTAFMQTKHFPRPAGGVAKSPPIFRPAGARDSSTAMHNIPLKGWFTPNCYTGNFRELPSAPGLYAFVKVDLSEPSKPAYDVMYIGMSKNIAKRCTSHDTLRAIRKVVDYVQIHFLPCSEDLRRAERVAIEEFNPSWNIIGRRRGIR